VNDQPMTPEDMHLKAIPEDMTLYEMFSWDQQCIPSKARVGQIPKPGVFFVVVPMLNGQEGGIYALMLQVKQHLSRDDGPAKFQRHIAGPWAHWSPQPLSTFDVLISASDVDDAVAIDIETRLAESGLSTERSVRPSTAELGDESLRRRLLECQVLISVLTKVSARDPRVAIEAGACWVLTKPFVPVLSGLAKAELPPSMAARQCVEVDDQTAVNRLPAQIRALVLGR
jgi:hypothetical protein